MPAARWSIDPDVVDAHPKYRIELQYWRLRCSSGDFTERGPLAPADATRPAEHAARHGVSVETTYTLLACDRVRSTVMSTVGCGCFWVKVVGP